MTNFETYMEKINVHYDFLKKYYNSDDIASIHGVDKYEIKHSNVLKWILEPKGDEPIDYLPIRCLLKLVQNNNQYYEFFNNIDLDICRIKEVKIQRETIDHIDIQVTLKINDDNYIVAIENKLESSIHDNQLEIYKKKLENRYPKHHKLYVFLHPGINVLQDQEAKNSQYITITYQEVYDKILNVVEELSSNATLKFIIHYYIHTLCCYESNELFGLIVTEKERESLKSLFNDSQIITMIEKLYNNELNNEYFNYYNKNKTNFYKIFKKYLKLKTANPLLKSKIEKILKYKSYILNGNCCNSISELLSLVFNELLKVKGKTLDDIEDLLYLFSSTDPLLIHEKEVLNTEHPKWYTKEFEYQGKKYYILSAWRSKEYEELKKEFEQLKIDNPSVYEGITIE